VSKPYGSIGAWGGVLIFMGGTIAALVAAWILFPAMGERTIDLLFDVAVPYLALAGVVWFSVCLVIKAVKG